MPKNSLSHIARVAFTAGLVLVLCTGCGDDAQATDPSGLGVAPGAGQFAQAPSAAVTAGPGVAARTPVPAFDHGATSSFWPNPQWTPPQLSQPVDAGAQPDPRAGGPGLFGIPDGSGTGTQVARVATPEPAPRQETPASSAGGTLIDRRQNKASWYGPGFHGRKTANGEIYDQNKMTAAMTGVPLGIRVRVERTDTGKSIEVRVNDRGPYERKNGKWVPHPTRIIDLSKKAMQELGGIDAGIISVKVYRLD